LQEADVIAGHHVSADLAVLTRSLPGWRPAPAVDTVPLAHALHPGLSSYRLFALADAWGLAREPVGGRPHRAGYDATITARLLLHLIQAMDGDPSPADLHALTHRR
jgi:DNA polymerase III epsilon subunit-like protein